MPDSKQEKFHAGIWRNLRDLRTFSVTALEFSPRKDSLLHWAGDEKFSANVRIACDNAMAIHVLAEHAWQPEELKFIEWVLRDGKPATLVDVGANMGLFTRQALIRLPAIEHTFAYEPHAGNFDLLRFNLAPFERIECVNAALADADGRLELFLDPENCGNYSLTKAAMPADFSSTRVEVRSALQESQRWLAPSNPVFYKSDTQGFDELIATQFDLPFWTNVRGGIMELWQIDKPGYDAGKLEAILDSFPYKNFLNTPDPVSSAQVLDYLRSREGGFADLGFWR